MVLCQSLSGAIILELCNVVLDSSLRSQLPLHAPHADADAIINAGATGFQAIVQPEDLPGVLLAWANSVDRVFYLVAAVAAGCSIVLWGMGGKKASENQDTEKGS